MPYGKEKNGEPIFFESGGIQLEGLISVADKKEGVIVTHPHSLYGGNMNNAVAESVCSAYREKGFSVLRFNFRGVGQSGGRFSDGIGEQQDVLAAVSYMQQRGIPQISLAGYSFGAWVTAHAPYKEADIHIHSIIMISPPVAFMPFDPNLSIPGLKLVVTGSQDDIAPPSGIRTQMAVWNEAAAFEVISGADHFFSGCLKQLKLVLDDFIR